MIAVGFELSYDPELMVAPEDQRVAFDLSPRYGVGTAEAASELLIRLYWSSDPFFVEGADGYVWDFWRETVIGFWTCEKSRYVYRDS